MLTLARGGLIERPGVKARIAAALRDGSVLLIAGAGYGKTTALRQALGQTDRKAAWVRCGDARGDAGRLLTLILDAVLRAAPGAADALAERLASVRAPIDAALAARALERELACVLVEPLVIVFDDAETLTGAPAAIEVIAHLLLSESELVRVALASRHRPDIQLAREQATGRIAELGPADLTFTANESAAFLRQTSGHDPEPAAVQGLMEATDGWPLGVALAASGPSPALAHQYFSEEVLAPLGAELRGALLLASLAPDLEVAEQAGLGPRHGFAAAIEHHALFVRPASPDGGPELHPLFREFLRTRYAAETPASEQAIDEPDATGNLLARATGVAAAAGLARQGRFDEGLSVFDRALDDPAGRALDGPAPTFAGYYLELPAGRLDDAVAHAREAVTTLQTADPTGRLGYALTYLMAILEERGEDGEALAVAQRTREWSQRVGLSGWIGVALAIRSASLRARSGDVAGAEADLAEVPSAWTVWGTWELDATRAAITSLRGDGHGALTAAERASREATARWAYFDRARCAALLAPTLVRARHPRRARQLVEHTIKSRVPGFSTARLYAVLAWLLHDGGDESGSTAALAAAWQEAGDQITHIVRREWPRLEGPIWVALEHGSIGVDVAVEALAAARPGGAALAGFTRHPVPTVRRAALLGSVTAGHPQGFESVPQLLRDPDVTVAAAAGAAAELLRRTPPPLSFRLLGRFELRRGTWLVDDAAWERRIAQRVVRLLLCRGGRPVLEDELIDAFWPDKTADSARRSVQVAVSAARAILDPPGVEHSRLVCTERTYRLRFMEHDTVDAEQFERAAARALAAPADAQRSALLAAASMWTGEPLHEERYAEWSTSWRERLKDRYGEVLAGLSTAHEQAGELSRATSVARALVELDPLNEAAHRRLIVAYARTGRRSHALRQFLECRHALVTALGIEPGEETIALQRRVLGGERI